MSDEIIYKGRHKNVVVQAKRLNPETCKFEIEALMSYPILPDVTFAMVRAEVMNDGVNEIAERLGQVLYDAALMGVNVEVRKENETDPEGNPMKLAMGNHRTVAEVYPYRGFVSMAYQAKDEREKKERILANHARIKKIVDNDVFYNHPAAIMVGEAIDGRIDKHLEIFTYLDREGLPQVVVQELGATAEEGERCLYRSDQDVELIDKLSLNRRIEVFVKRLVANKVLFLRSIFDTWPWPATTSASVAMEGQHYVISREPAEPVKATVAGIETYASPRYKGRCIQCDRCKAEYNGGNGTTKAGPIRVYRGGDEDQMLEDAKALGWEQCSVDGHVEDHCPKCVAALKYYAAVLQYTVSIEKFPNIVKARHAANNDREFFRTYYVVPNIPDAGPFSTAGEVAEHLIKLMKYDEKHDEHYKSTEINRIEDGKETTINRTEPR